MQKSIFLFAAILFTTIFCNETLTAQSVQYTMPGEEEPHEGTWLQWPHQYEYGVTYRNRLDATWVAMAKALVTSEKVHIIAYDATEQTRITNLLTSASVPLTNIDFRIFETNDVWVRDNGPIFVRDANGTLMIEDWGFNGWGGKYDYDKCNLIPASIGNAIGMNVINLNSVMVNEGGAVETDGNGVFLATRSSILSQSPANTVRNPGMTQAQAEAIFTQYSGFTKFIWLDGVAGDPYDITDMHIDGFAKFANDSILVTMNNTDLTYWGVPAADITTLYNASDVNNKPYTHVYLPLTQNDVVTAYGNNLGFKGSYINYYVANNAVLVPNYNDPNDAAANSIIQNLYSGRAVTGIDCRNLYENGGMVHCVTQQQPVATNTSGFSDGNCNAGGSLVFPNPFNYTAALQLKDNPGNCILTVYNTMGQEVQKTHNISGKAITIYRGTLPEGIYHYTLTHNNTLFLSGKFVIKN